MPPTNQPQPEKTLQEVVDSLGLYPVEAFRFIEDGLIHTVEHLNPPPATSGSANPAKAKLKAANVEAAAEPRHITGQQLCEGLRDYALAQWGMLARMVLHRWRIESTKDFGKIVYALIDAGLMQKTDRDSIDDFRDVFDFTTAFERGYRIELGCNDAGRIGAK